MTEKVFCLKQSRVKGFLKNWYFLAFAVLALVLPDILVRLAVPENPFGALKLPIAAVNAFSAGWIILVIFICTVFLNRRWGRIIFIIFSSVFVILSLCQYVYHGIFGQFFWLKSIALLGEGGEYLSYALDYVDAKCIICIVLSILCIVCTALGWRQISIKKSAWRLLVLLPVIVIVTLHMLLSSTLLGSSDDWDSWNRPWVVYKNFSDVNKDMSLSGLYQHSLRDLWRTIFPPQKYTEEEYKEADDYFAAKPQPSANEYTGILKGKNVIAVMLEGIDTWMIDQKHTPTMYEMQKNGISFANYYSPFFGTGHTLNAEFAFNTGFFSPITAVSAVNFCSNEFPYSLANRFTEAGYTANSFHYNDPEFYNRGVMHKSFGYERYNSFTDFGIPETVSQADSNVLKNDDVYNKMVAKKPFFSFVITYSTHVPYTFDDAKLSLAKENHPELIDPAMDKEKNNCLILAADTDDFFRQLLDRLEADGLLEDTVILAFTDHYAYGFSDQQKLEEYKNHEILYRVPAFIYAKGLEAKAVEKPMMTIDWLPTLANLFDLNRDGKYLGNDILDPNYDGFAYFGNAAWLDNKMYYVPSDEEPNAEDREHIQEQNKRVQQSFRINDIVITGDYFAHR